VTIDARWEEVCKIRESEEKELRGHKKKARKGYGPGKPQKKLGPPDWEQNPQVKLGAVQDRWKGD